MDSSVSKKIKIEAENFKVGKIIFHNGFMWKNSWNYDPGSQYTGHTDYYAVHTNCSRGPINVLKNVDVAGELERELGKESWI